MHRLDEDRLITPALLRRFEAESADEGSPESGPYHAIIMRSNGDLIEHVMGPRVASWQFVFVNDLLKALNRDLHHDGAWVAVYTHPAPAALIVEVERAYMRLVLMWMDGDGDVRIPFEIEEADFSKIVEQGLHRWLGEAETAWQTWKKLMIDVLDPKSDQLYKRAQGQAPTSSRLH